MNCNLKYKSVYDDIKKCYNIYIYMFCNKIIHDEISKEYDYINCPFCYKKINEIIVKKNRF